MKAKWMEARLAVHINSTMPVKSSLLPSMAAFGHQFQVIWQLSHVSYEV